MAEAILNGVGQGRFRAFSAGSHPTGKVNSFALEQIERAGLSSDGFRSKSWDEFAQPGAPAMDFVFTVCSDAAGEVCPIWPEHPMTAHWGVDDPARHDGTDAEKRRAFALGFAQLSHRIRTFVSLPIDRLDRLSLKKNLEAIGKS
jgi:arsenate reductase